MFILLYSILFTWAISWTKQIKTKFTCSRGLYFSELWQIVSQCFQTYWKTILPHPLSWLLLNISLQDLSHFKKWLLNILSNLLSCLPCFIGHLITENATQDSGIVRDSRTRRRRKPGLLNYHFERASLERCITILA